MKKSSKVEKKQSKVKIYALWGGRPKSIQSFEFDSAAEAKAFVRGACAYRDELGDGGADGDFYLTRDAKEARQLLKEAQSDDWDGYPYTWWD